ncbi:MAG: F0F1 ATP synthase subunit B [Chthoniobacterales bacterium]|nr:F0F1 ATP synthase subunit B [Chthoniobacterales bacterium]
MDFLSDLFANFGINWPKFLSQIILFATVYFILSKFAFKPVINMLEERRRRIEESQLNAEKIKKQLAEAELRYQEILRKANEDAANILKEAKAVSEEATQRQLKEAARQAEQLLARTREEISAERDKMISEVKAEMVNLVIQTASKVTGKILTPEDHNRLAEETTRQLAA